MESDRELRAQRLFQSGYNCAQSVLGAFEGKLPLPVEQLMRLGAPMGAGMGRLREVCGAVSAMFLIDGLLSGDASPDPETKREQYQRVQALAEGFERENGSIVCRNLLGLAPLQRDDPTPMKRGEEYYRKRPCVELVKSAVRILEQSGY